MSTTAKSGKAVNVADDAFASLSAVHREAIDSFMEMSQVIFKGLVEYNKELTNFVAGRVVTDLDLQQRLFECRSAEDVMALQGDFVETAVSQYSAEAQKLASIGSDVVNDDLQAISRQAKPLARKASA